MDDLGARIREARKRKGLTLKDLADRTKLSVPYLSDLERRQVNPTLETLRKVADALGVAVSVLVGGTPDGVPSVPSMPASLSRYANSSDFASRVAKAASRSRQPVADVRESMVNLMMAAPKRSKGELGEDDWKRIADVYMMLIDD